MVEPLTWIQGNGSTNHYGDPSGLGDYIATWNMRGTNTDGVAGILLRGNAELMLQGISSDGQDSTATRVIIYSIR